MDLVESIYQTTRGFPKEETYGLVAQMRRAVASIPANIAEGQGRRQKGEFRQFLGHARGSLLELDTHLETALRVGYLSNQKYQVILAQINEVGRLINGLLRALSS
jgi:four helix bundle protein